MGLAVSRRLCGGCENRKNREKKKTESVEVPPLLDLDVAKQNEAKEKKRRREEEKNAELGWPLWIS